MFIKKLQKKEWPRLLFAIVMLLFIAVIAVGIGFFIITAFPLYPDEAVPEVGTAAEDSQWPDGRRYWGARLDLLEAQVVELQQVCETVKDTR